MSMKNQHYFEYDQNQSECDVSDKLHFKVWKASLTPQKMWSCLGDPFISCPFIINDFEKETEIGKDLGFEKPKKVDLILNETLEWRNEPI